MLDVFFTVDMEIWCGGWKNIDAKFPQAFQQYVYGRTPKGEYGLRYKLQRLRDHGLLGVFFVEPLFATRFGIEPLAEIIGLIKEYGQEVQLHMHPEWVDESTHPLLPEPMRKRPFMRDFSLNDQTTLIAKGIQLIGDAGGGRVNAFRAGSFGFNRDTLSALATNNIEFDSSYNASYFGLESGLAPNELLVEPFRSNGVMEFPMTVFDDGTRSLRHTQLGAISAAEMEGLLWQSLKQNRKTFVILSHNFELLNRTRDMPDEIVVNRFNKLCSFLDKNREVFHMAGFKGMSVEPVECQPLPLVSPFWKTGFRMVEQLSRKRFG
jgi:hypothetical protein